MSGAINNSRACACGAQKERRHQWCEACWDVLPQPDKVDFINMLADMERQVARMDKFCERRGMSPWQKKAFRPGDEVEIDNALLLRTHFGGKSREIGIVVDEERKDFVKVRFSGDREFSLAENAIKHRK